MNAQDAGAGRTTAYEAGDICWTVADPEEPVLVLAVCDSTPLGRGRVLESYLGCSFRPDEPPDAVERFAVVVHRATH